MTTEAISPPFRPDSGLPQRKWPGRLRVGPHRAVDAARTARARRAAGAAAARHPQPELLASLRFGQLPGDLVDYRPAEPLLVVELDADVCFEHDRSRRPAGFRRVCGDLRPADLA
jgi:hypothetical protein